MNMTRPIFIAALLTSTTLSGSALALAQYQNEVPNGFEYRCLTCHVSSGGGEGWNDFGQAILVAGGANPGANPTDQDLGFTGVPSQHWADICGDDSDGDGATNGEELGDPDCVWVLGDDDPEVEEVSNPGDATSVIAGGGGGEGEGEGEGEPDGCWQSSQATTAAPLGLALALGVLLPVRRRKR